MPRTLPSAAFALAVVFAAVGPSAQNGGPLAAPVERLPWQSSDEGGGPQSASPRAMLELGGVDESQLRQFNDGGPLDGGEEETLVRILYRLPRFGRYFLEQWQTRTAETPLSAVVENPDAHRAEVFQLRGRAHRVERRELAPEMADLVEFDHYFLVHLKLDDSPHPAILAATEVPQAWRVGEPIDRRMTAPAMFLKLGAGEGEQSQLVFAAHRPAWRPDRVEPSAGVGEDQLLLARLGVDLGLFDRLRARNGREIGGEDREAFYQMLAAARDADVKTLRQHAEPLDLGPLFSNPKDQHGRLSTVRGIAWRAQKVLVEEPDVQQRFGIDHYYQIDIFVPLGDYRISLRQPDGAAEGGAAPQFTDRFPVTVATPELPAGLREGVKLNEVVRIPAFFFKMYAYRSEYVSSFEGGQKQVSPLFIGAGGEVVDTSVSTNPLVSLAVGAAFVLALVLLWYVLWRQSRRDKQFERRTLDRPTPGAKSPSLNQLDIEDESEPNFDHLK